MPQKNALSLDEVAKGVQENRGTADVSNVRGPGVSPGDAVLRCEDVYFERSRTKGRLQMVAACTIIAHEDSDQAGNSIQKRWGLEKTEDNDPLAWLKADCENVGITPLTAVTTEELQRMQSEWQGICFAAALTENPGYPPNIFINANARRDEKNAVQNLDNSRL